MIIKKLLGCCVFSVALCGCSAQVKDDSSPDVKNVSDANGTVNFPEEYRNFTEMDGDEVITYDVGITGGFVDWIILNKGARGVNMPNVTHVRLGSGSLVVHASTEFNGATLLLPRGLKRIYDMQRKDSGMISERLSLSEMRILAKVLGSSVNAKSFSQE